MLLNVLQGMFQGAILFNIFINYTGTKKYVLKPKWQVLEQMRGRLSCKNILLLGDLEACSNTKQDGSL